MHINLTLESMYGLDENEEYCDVYVAMDSDSGYHGVDTIPHQAVLECYRDRYNSETKIRQQKENTMTELEKYQQIGAAKTAAFHLQAAREACKKAGIDYLEGDLLWIHDPLKVPINEQQIAHDEDGWPHGYASIEIMIDVLNAWEYQFPLS